MILKPAYDYADPDHPMDGAQANPATGDIAVAASTGVAGTSYPRAGVGGEFDLPTDADSIGVTVPGLLVAYNCSARSYVLGWANAAAHIKIILWQDGTDFQQSPYNQDITLYNAHFFEETGNRTRSVDLSTSAANLPVRHHDQLWRVAVYVTAAALAGGAAGADARCSTTVGEIHYGFF